ncbi:hypothetical protein [Bacillus sp. FSL K6-3431]|uniref:hypothetical protein n=1 Tax=Bacillus sp. FSL K6-3431 TaxID=2921500 RepID=UPI0030FBC1AE
MINLEVLTHDGELFNVEVAEYDAMEVNEKLNDSEVNTVVIGDFIFGRFDIKRIVTKA